MAITKTVPHARWCDRITTAAHAEIDLGVRWNSDPEKYARDLDREAKATERLMHELVALSHAHILVIRDFGYECRFCHKYFGEEPPCELPECCEEAIEAVNRIGE